MVHVPGQWRDQCRAILGQEGDASFPPAPCTPCAPTSHLVSGRGRVKLALTAAKQHTAKCYYVCMAQINLEHTGNGKWVIDVWVVVGPRLLMYFLLDEKFTNPQTVEAWTIEEGAQTAGEGVQTTKGDAQTLPTNEEHRPVCNTVGRMLSVLAEAKVEDVCSR